jgi:hypothetical protein
MNQVWAFARTYVLALITLMVIGLGVTILVRQIATNPTPGFGAPRPTPAQLRTYVLRYAIGAATPVSLQVDVDGAACRALATNADLATACVLALNLDPAFIASAALGRLNVEDTPAFYAIIWRATLDKDPAICERGGLLDGRLSRCRIAATTGSFQQVQDGLTITITP